jgi:tetratricopeptide (TPR) repeat protein
VNSGESPTGAVTPTLFESLHGPLPSAQARAKGLFRLASEARLAQQLNDGIHLYEAGLKLQPNDQGALLSLADLYNEKSDYDAARHTYEVLQRMGGPPAEAATQRLASLNDHHDRALEQQTALAVPQRGEQQQKGAISGKSVAIAVALNPKGDWVVKVASSWELAGQQAIAECNDKFGFCSISDEKLSQTTSGCMVVASSGFHTAVKVGSKFDDAAYDSIAACNRIGPRHGKCTIAYSLCR